MFFMPSGMPGSIPRSGSGGMFSGLFGGEDPREPDRGESQEDDEKEVDNLKLYKLLDVSKDASSSEIKKAYHRMAIKHHPDKGGDPETFKEISRAFEVLSDPQQRKRYDLRGEEGLNDDGPSHPQDIFEHMFGGGRGGPGRRSAQRPRTKDRVRPMWVTLEQLYTGITRPLPITRKVMGDGNVTQVCQRCNGKGFEVQVIRMGPMIQQMQQQCPLCSGSGSSASMKTQREVLEVFVEKGSPDGHKITFHGRADEAQGCEPGDVVVVVKQQEHPEFMRKGADLYLEREVSLADALTGFKIVISHLDGRELVIRNKPGEVLQPQHGGTALKAVKGGGMPIHQDPFNFGNLFLVLSIRFPNALEPTTAAELRKLLGEAEEEEQDGTQSAAPMESRAEDVEQVFVEDIDPLESSKQSTKPGGEAYDEDEESAGPGMQRVECKQQ